MKFDESKTQQACIKWFRYHFTKHVICSIPNGAVLSGDKMQRIRQWKRLQSEGALPGMPDVFIAMRNDKCNGLFIEFKSEKGKLTETQKAIHALLINAGYCVKICRTLDEFISIIKTYNT